MILMDFQKTTADRIITVFRSGQNRVLLADEVGLGKTIIARDVIRQAADWHKHEKGTNHFRVVYICSNINIAKQNAKRLGVGDLINISESRLSMQHLKIYENKGRNNSFEQLIPLTPATSFSMTSGCGIQEERALMYAHLWRLPMFRKHKENLCQLLAYEARKNWLGNVKEYEKRVQRCDSNGSSYISEMSLELTRQFEANNELMESIAAACRNKGTLEKSQVRVMINSLRRVFAQISLDKLEPDLVIMDEFQRFRNLIAPSDDEQGMLTKHFLKDTAIKVLLLSATPYKLYSTLEEMSLDEDADHYKEFLEVMEFLFYNEGELQNFKQIWGDYSNTLCEISQSDFTVLLARKNRAEDVLYSNVCRTERSNSGIIDDGHAKEVSISNGDILSYIELQALLDEINRQSKRPLYYRNVPIDYVKSSPYLLSFMDRYQLKKQIVDHLARTQNFKLVAGSKSKRLLLKKSTIHNYRSIASNNARLEKLKDIVFDGGKNGAENLLWIPPSKFYYKTGSVFDKNKGYSKVLVFSSWEMVPRMVSVMLSYEAERLTIGKLFHDARFKRGRGYFATREERRFGIARLRNETEEIVCHVSDTLAKLYDPEEHMGKDLRQIRRELRKRLQPELKAVQRKYGLLESRSIGAKSLLELIKALDNDPKAAPTAISAEAIDLLVNMAIGSPAICAYRLFAFDEALAKRLAKQVFVSLFNKAESSAILDLLYGRKSDDFYYQHVFRYCVDGNLQAMLDEYAHILGENGEALADVMIKSFVDTASLQIDTLESFTGKEEKARMRTHYAIGYFDARISTENVLRAERIREAFNSPFRPFVLTTTSIGQEGLDFHCYCRKVMHWNLPANPTDLEQREGRVSRYKCLAVRQNVAHKYGDEKTWDAMFAAARAEKGDLPDLVPFWCLADGESALVKIERIVPMYPLSQDRLRYSRLIKILSLYRLTLGQPRQEELIELLTREFLLQLMISCL